MKAVSVLLIALIAIVSSTPRSNVPQRRITGGINAREGQFPHQVALHDKKGKHLCGGALLNERYAITAASCVEDKVEDEIVLKVGSIKMNFLKSYTLARITTHPNYATGTKLADLALLLTNKKIAFDRNTGPIKLAPYLVTDGELQVSGWGSTSSRKTPSQDLKFIYTNYVEPEDCQRMLPMKLLNSDSYCTLNKNQIGLCHFDAGDPLVNIDGDGTATLVGIASFYTEPCAEGFPDVFVSLVGYKKWIDQNTQVGRPGSSDGSGGRGNGSGPNREERPPTTSRPITNRPTTTKPTTTKPTTTRPTTTRPTTTRPTTRKPTTTKPKSDCACTEKPEEKEPVDEQPEYGGDEYAEQPNDGVIY